jgi:3-polyprenyl-4-hydroxybenzoate decarboxylase
VAKSPVHNATTGDLNVMGRIMKGARCIGYGLSDSIGNIHDVYREEVIRLIVAGRVTNMMVRRVNTVNGPEIVISGKGLNLNTLPVININRV